MSRGPADPLSRQVLARIETLQDARSRHRADGRLSPEEDAIEARMVSELVMFAAEADEAFSIGQAIQRYGPQCGHAQRLLRFRARRQFRLIIGGRDDREVA